MKTTLRTQTSTLCKDTLHFFLRFIEGGGQICQILGAPVQAQQRYVGTPPGSLHPKFTGLNQAQEQLLQQQRQALGWQTQRGTGNLSPNSRSRLESWMCPELRGCLGLRLLHRLLSPSPPKKPITLALSPWLRSNCRREKHQDWSCRGSLIPSSASQPKYSKGALRWPRDSCTIPAHPVPALPGTANSQEKPSSGWAQRLQN